MKTTLHSSCFLFFLILIFSTFKAQQPFNLSKLSGPRQTLYYSLGTQSRAENIAAF